MSKSVSYQVVLYQGFILISYMQYVLDVLAVKSNKFKNMNYEMFLFYRQ